MAPYDPREWHDFYVMAGGAAAALTGLLFVAMSLHAAAIRNHPVYGSRAVGTLMGLIAQLLISAAVLVPGQTSVTIGIEVEAAALFFVVITFRAIAGRGRGYVATMGPLRRWSELVAASVWMVLFVTSGVSLVTGAGGGFYILAIVMLFMFAWNVYVAWVLITEVSS